MTDFSDDLISESIEQLMRLLSMRLSTGNAYSEYELLCWLQQPEQNVFAEDALADSVSLFRCHFLLMHALYCLRERWLLEQRARLEISALRIQCHPFHTCEHQQLAMPDPLAQYYLNLDELRIERSDIEALLHSFWQRFIQPVGDNTADLAILGLTQGVTLEEIRLQYRKLAMRHHPDRGGNADDFRTLQAAYLRLKERHHLKIYSQ